MLLRGLWRSCRVASRSLSTSASVLEQLQAPHIDEATVLQINDAFPSDQAFHAEMDAYLDAPSDNLANVMKLRAASRSLLAHARRAAPARTLSSALSPQSIALERVSLLSRIALSRHFEPQHLRVSVVRSASVPNETLALMKRASAAVHVIGSDSEAATRFDSAGKLCFALYHKRLEMPLMFVETSLVDRLAAEIQPLLTADAAWHRADARQFAIFYAIVSTQPAALAGLDLGRVLIHNAALAVTELDGASTILDESAKRCVREALAQPVTVTSTLSPMPLLGVHKKDLAQIHDQEQLVATIKRYLLETKKGNSHFAFDPVAHFHLSNGARVENICTFADRSASSLCFRQSHGHMVNYRYVLSDMSSNAFNYVQNGLVKTGNELI